MGRLSHRGTEVKFIGEMSTGSVIVPKGINPYEWDWNVVISVRWRFMGEHINFLEGQAYKLTLQWRLRSVSNVGTRFLHFLDSGVTLGICCKGRTSSNRLRKVLLRISALILGGHLQPALGFCRNHLNPSDKPSCFFGYKRSSASSARPAPSRAAIRQRRGD